MASSNRNNSVIIIKQRSICCFRTCEIKYKYKCQRLHDWSLNYNLNIFKHLQGSNWNLNSQTKQLIMSSNSIVFLSILIFTLLMSSSLADANITVTVKNLCSDFITIYSESDNSLVTPFSEGLTLGNNQNQNVTFNESWFGSFFEQKLNASGAYIGFFWWRIRWRQLLDNDDWGLWIRHSNSATKRMYGTNLYSKPMFATSAFVLCRRRIHNQLLSINYL